MIHRFEKLSKEETLDEITKFLFNQLSLAERQSEDNENYSLPSWELLQADIIGRKKSLRKILEYLGQ